MILVTGSTGFIGRHLVARLLEAGKPVRVLLPEYKLRNLPWEHPPEIVVGSILSEEALFKAVSGVHTIIHLENAQWWGRQRDLERIEVAGTRVLISVARSARVGRIITLSHLGAAASSAYMVLRAKGLVEDQIRASGLAYTIIRTGFVFGREDAFINHFAMQLASTPLVFLLPGRGEVVLHPIYVDDLVEILTRSLEAVNSVDQTIEIGGPEYVTLSDLVRTVMRVSRIRRVIVPVPPYLLRFSTRIYSAFMPRSVITSQWLDLLASNHVAKLGNAYEYFGVRPRRFEDALMTYLPGRRYFWMLLRYSLRRRPRRL